MVPKYVDGRQRACRGTDTGKIRKKDLRMTPPSTSALHSAASLLEAAGVGTADLDALAKAAGGDDDLLLGLARRRAEGTPLAHLTGIQRFLGLELLAEPGVVVPRPETELLARTAIEALRAEGAGELHVLDLCCGAGNLACAVASQPTARVWASDISPAAVKLARRNALHTGLAARVHVAEGNLFAPLAGMALEASFDAVVCNPPYISTRRLETERAGLPARATRGVRRRTLWVVGAPAGRAGVGGLLEARRHRPVRGR